MVNNIPFWISYQQQSLLTRQQTGSSLESKTNIESLLNLA